MAVCVQVHVTIRLRTAKVLWLIEIGADWERNCNVEVQAYSRLSHSNTTIFDLFRQENIFAINFLRSIDMLRCHVWHDGISVEKNWASLLPPHVFDAGTHWFVIVLKFAISSGSASICKSTFWFAFLQSFLYWLMMPGRNFAFNYHYWKRC